MENEKLTPEEWEVKVNNFLKKEKEEVYGDVWQSYLPDMPGEMKLEFVRDAVREMVNDAIAAGVEPEFGSIEVIVAEDTAERSGPLCRAVDGTPQKYVMSVGLKFKKKKAEEDNHD